MNEVPEQEKQKTSQGIYDFEAEKLDGEIMPMGELRGQVVLIVNTASRCGFTAQYKGLQALQEKYAEKGFVVLGFPCNQFAFQEPGGVNSIMQCLHMYNVNFPVFKKIKVNGKKAHPLYRYLTKTLPGLMGKGIKWNFTKFLVNKQGIPVRRYSPSTAPESIGADIETVLRGGKLVQS